MKDQKKLFFIQNINRGKVVEHHFEVVVKANMENMVNISNNKKNSHIGG
jgi:hypothetical protein